MDTPGAEYRPLSLTLVEYKKGDILGFLMAWISMLPLFYIIALVTVIIIRRDLTTIFYSIGIVLTEITNAILKNLIKQPRPSQTSSRTGNFSKYGMPSDHSQIMFYASSFLVLLIFYRCYYKTNSRLYQILVKSTLAAIAIISAVLVAFSRVYLEYHTIEQVLVGAVLGTVMGCVWFFLVHNIFANHFFIITTWKISEFFMIRDYSHIPNVMLFQYTVERNEANIRRKNKMKWGSQHGQSFNNNINIYREWNFEFKFNLDFMIILVYFRHMTQFHFY